MRILHVIDSLAIGGAERMLVEIANASAADGHQVSVCITRSSRIDLAEELRPEIELHVLNRMTRFDLSALHTYNSFTQKYKFHIIHVHGRSSFSFCAVANTFQLAGSPIILHDHYGRIETDQKVPFWFRVWGRNRVAKYIGVYEKLRNWALAAGITPANISIIGNGIDLERLNAPPLPNVRQLFGIGPTTQVGIVVAGLRPEKGVDLLIESLSRCEKLDIKILVVGGIRDQMYVDYCRQLAEGKGVADYFVFTGERKDVASLCRAVDFALIPSRSESGPLVLIEFLACGLPVIAFRVGDITQAAFEYQVPGIIEPNDVDAFAHALVTLLKSSSTERRERGLCGRAVAREHFSIQSKMAAFYKVYQQALSDA